MFIDEAEIYVQAGDGGHGMVSFRREAYVPKGGPNGGDGGNGGSVIMVADTSVDTLTELASRHHWRAEPGQPGGSSSCHGRNGKSLYIHVPHGTLIYDKLTGELIGDLDEPDAQCIVAHGGKGGYGNEHFKGPTNQTPRTATPGTPGEERELKLELKLIADVGLIGKPNAGKSTLLSVLSRATPRIADYPFTTLSPQLGIAELSGHRRLVIADIPGLIEGASAGSGLGHTFLRHIERTRVLVHVLEIEPTDASDPIDNYQTINAELQQYSPTLAGKPQIVVLSKLDLLPDEEDRRTAMELIEQGIGRPVMGISAAERMGLKELLERCFATVHGLNI